MKSALTTILALLMAFVFNKGCDGDKQPFTKDVNLEELTKFAGMSKSACFGKCPVYDLTIYDNGVIAFQGDNHTEKMGLHVKKLSSGEIKALKKYITDVDIWQFDDYYPTQATDLPSTTVSHYKNGKQKKVSGSINRPAEIKELGKYLENLANSAGWILKEAPPEKPTEDMPDHFIKNEIIAQFKKDVDVEAFVANFIAFDLKIKKRIAPNLDMWLLTFNTEEIEPYRMLRELKKTDEVIEANFNKEVSQRDGNGRN